MCFVEKLDIECPFAGQSRGDVWTPNKCWQYQNQIHLQPGYKPVCLVLHAEASDVGCAKLPLGFGSPEYQLPEDDLDTDVNEEASCPFVLEAQLLVAGLCQNYVSHGCAAERN